MAKCPRCRVEVANPRKSWKMAGRPDKTGKRTELTIELFDCPKCKKSFRKKLSKRKGLLFAPMRGPMSGSTTRGRPRSRRSHPTKGPIGPPDNGNGPTKPTH